MKLLTCECCGSGDLIKQNGVFVCQHCGMKYSSEEIKNIVGTVKIDNSKKLKEWYASARLARDSGDNINAGNYYNMILREDPTSWEATFFTVYCQAIQCRVFEIEASTNMIFSAFQNALVKLCASNQRDQKKAQKDFDVLFKYVLIFVDSVSSTCFPLLSEATNKNDTSSVSFYTGKIKAQINLIRDIMLFLSSGGEKLFLILGPDKMSKEVGPTLSKKVIGLTIRFLNITASYFGKDWTKQNFGGLVQSLEEEIKEVQKTEPSYVPPQCYARDWCSSSTNNNVLALISGIGILGFLLFSYLLFNYLFG